MPNIQISAGGSLHFRLYLTDCSGLPVTPDQVASIHFTLFELLPPHDPVEGYSSLTIPTTAILESVQTDEDGREFNVDFNPYVPGRPMFPERFTSYGAEIVFYDMNGKPSAHQIQVDAI